MYQIKTTLVNGKYVQPQLFINLITHRSNVSKVDIHVTQLYIFKRSKILWIQMLWMIKEIRSWPDVSYASYNVQIYCKVGTRWLRDQHLK